MILKKDPYNEDACLGLLQLYIATHQKGRAALLHKKFVRRFEKDLNMKPHEKLSSIFWDKGTGPLSQN
jgi:DNA-binding SARP family transcriptional activator